MTSSTSSYVRQCATNLNRIETSDIKKLGNIAASDVVGFFEDFGAANQILRRLVDILNSNVNSEATGNQAKIASLVVLCNLAKSPEYSSVLINTLQDLTENFESLLSNKAKAQDTFGVFVGTFHQLVLVLLMRLQQYELTASELLEWLDGDTKLLLKLVGDVAKVTSYEDDIVANIAAILQQLVQPQTYFSAATEQTQHTTIDIEEFLSRVDLIVQCTLSGRPSTLETLSTSLQQRINQFKQKVSRYQSVPNTKAPTLSFGIVRAIIAIQRFIHTCNTFIGDSSATESPCDSGRRHGTIEWFRQALLNTSGFVDELCIPFVRVCTLYLHAQTEKSDTVDTKMQKSILVAIGHVLLSIALLSFSQPIPRLRIQQSNPTTDILNMLLTICPEKILTEKYAPLIGLCCALCVNLDACAPLPPSREANPVLQRAWAGIATANTKQLMSHGPQRIDNHTNRTAGGKYPLHELLKQIGSSNVTSPANMKQTWQSAVISMTKKTQIIVANILQMGPQALHSGQIQSDQGWIGGWSWLRWLPIENSNSTKQFLIELFQRAIHKESDVSTQTNETLTGNHTNSIQTQPCATFITSRTETMTDASNRIDTQTNITKSSDSKISSDSKTSTIKSKTSHSNSRPPWKPTAKTSHAPKTSDSPTRHKLGQLSVSNMHTRSNETKLDMDATAKPSKTHNRTQSQYKETAKKSHNAHSGGYSTFAKPRNPQPTEFIPLPNMTDSAPPSVYFCSLSGSIMSEPVYRGTQDRMYQNRAYQIKKKYGKAFVSDISESILNTIPENHTSEVATDMDADELDPSSSALDKSAVVLSQGQYKYIWPVYERSAILAWLNRTQSIDNLSDLEGECPLTGASLKVSELKSADELRRDITSWHIRAAMTQSKPINTEGKQDEFEGDDLYEF